MIYVIATIELKPNCREAFLEIFQRNVPRVRAEKGCLNYEPTVDIETGLAAQGPLRDNVVTIVEAWEGLEALQTHLSAPHMTAYRAQVKDLVQGVTLQVVQPA
jgi:quinol monooxygenase YgiN